MESNPLLSLLLGAVPSIIQGITGSSQMDKANQLESQYKRPTAVVAPSVNKMVDYSYGQTMANDIPGGDIYRNEIKGATAAGMRQASELGSGAEAYGMLGQLVGNENKGMSDLAKTTAQQVAGFKGQYLNALGQKGQEENRIWNWNEAQPYLQAQQTAQQLRGSGTTNMFSGAKSLFGSAAEAVNPELNSSLLMGDGYGGGKSSVGLDEIFKTLQQFNPGMGQSKPLEKYNPSSNLLSTLSGLLHK